MGNKINTSALRDVVVNGGASFKESSSSFIFTCPRCKKSKKLYLHKQTGAFICFYCADTGFKGRAEYALTELLGIPLQDLREKLYSFHEYLESNTISFGFSDFDSDDSLVANILPIVEWDKRFVSSASWEFDRARKYLIERRGLREEHIVKYNIKSNPVWNTVVFPVTYNGELYGWQERSIYDDFRYTLKGFRKDKMLMFQDRLVGSKHAVLTEGPLDALKCNLAGGNVCAMGKGVSDVQLEIIQNHVKKLYVALDPDANVETEKICRKMSENMEVYLMEVPKNRKDFGECTEEEALNQFKEAKRYSGQVFFYFKGF